MEEQSGSKKGEEYVEAVYCHPVYLTHMQSDRATWGLIDKMACYFDIASKE